MQQSGAGNRARRGGLIALTMTTMMAAGCGGGGGGGGPSAGAAPTGAVPPTNPGSNAAPTIAATPASQAQVGSSYDVTPVAQDADGDTLAFSIQNKPAWAVFNTATGQLSGTPSDAHVGAYSDVLISVSDGASNASLPAFSITVAQAGTPVPNDGGSVALSWDVPTTTVDGGTLADLTGYRIHYGMTESALTDSIEVPSAGLNQYVVHGLQKGKYYFAVRAVTATGAQSETSNVVSRVIG